MRLMPGIQPSAKGLVRNNSIALIKTVFINSGRSSQTHGLLQHQFSIFRSQSHVEVPQHYEVQAGASGCSLHATNGVMRLLWSQSQQNSFSLNRAFERLHIAFSSTQPCGWKLFLVEKTPRSRRKAVYSGPLSQITYVASLIIHMIATRACATDQLLSLE